MIRTGKHLVETFDFETLITPPPPPPPPPKKKKKKKKIPEVTL